MFVNMHMKKFNLNDFQNICRACMSDNELQTLQDGHIKVLNLISKVQFSKTDELPQKICDRCVRRINDILSLALLCKRIDQTLKKYLENLKIENLSMDLNPLEPKEKIEFIDANEHVDLETNYVKMELDRLQVEFTRAELDEGSRERTNAEATPPEPISESAPLVVPVPHRLRSGAHAPKPRPHKCGYCVRTFTAKGMKRMHERQIHGVGAKHKCYKCMIVYGTATALKNHKRTHRPVLECDQCSRYFQSKIHLENHKKTHQDKYKPYECLICFKRFHLLPSYLKHNSVHIKANC